MFKKTISICLWFMVVCWFETRSHVIQADLKLIAEAELPILLNAGIITVPDLKACFLW